jgi:hypothetical protein
MKDFRQSTDAQVIEQDVGRVVDGKKSLSSKPAGLFQ